MYYVGIDLGGTNIAGGIVNDDGEIIKSKSIPTKRERSASEILKDMAFVANSLIEEAGLKEEEVAYIGIGSPGSIDSKNCIIMYANNLNFRRVNVKEEMRKYTKLPIYMDNDANCAGLGEAKFGGAKGTNKSLTITLGTGVGGGVIIDGKIFGGTHNAGAELGHMVIEKDGEQCSCGRKGCFEAYSSATAIARQGREAVAKDVKSRILSKVNGDITKIDAKAIFDAKDEGDETARAVVDNYLEYLAEGVANFISIFEPEVIAIGGGISKQGEKLLVPLRKKVYERVYGGVTPPVQLKVAELGNDAGIIGAAMLGIEN
jgi:glucokinase